MIYSPRLLTRALLACALALTLPACDSAPEDEEIGGGAGVSVSLEGSAYAYVEDDDEAGGLVVALFDRTVTLDAFESYEGDFLYFGILSDGAAITAGTYTYGSGDLVVLYGENIAFRDIETGEVSDADTYVALNGSVDITAISEERVSGSYDFSLASNAGDLRRARGSFSAAVTDQEILSSGG